MALGRCFIYLWALPQTTWKLSVGFLGAVWSLELQSSPAVCRFDMAKSSNSGLGCWGSSCMRPLHGSGIYYIMRSPPSLDTSHLVACRGSPRRLRSSGLARLKVLGKGSKVARAPTPAVQRGPQQGVAVEPGQPLLHPILAKGRRPRFLPTPVLTRARCWRGPPSDLKQVHTSGFQRLLSASSVAFIWARVWRCPVIHVQRFPGLSLQTLRSSP